MCFNFKLELSVVSFREIISRWMECWNRPEIPLKFFNRNGLDQTMPAGLMERTHFCIHPSEFLERHVALIHAPKFNSNKKQKGGRRNVFPGHSFSNALSKSMFSSLTNEGDAWGWWNLSLTLMCYLNRWEIDALLSGKGHISVNLSYEVLKSEIDLAFKASN